MFSLNKYFKNWQEKLFSKAPSSTRTTSKRRLKTKTLAEQTPQEQKRIQEIQQAFRQGKFIAEGDSPRLGIFRYQRVQNRKRSSARASVHCISHAVLQARSLYHSADVV